MVEIYLYHYFDKTIGPFVSLSDLPTDEAKSILDTIKVTKSNSQSAQRHDKYVEYRHNCENIIRSEFAKKGGVMNRISPHYMVIEHSPWLFEHYEFDNGFRILELGCGNGDQWQGRIEELPSDCTLILSDYSEGMVKMVWDKYSCQKNILTQKIDIQNIPFPDNCYDVVIANHMLYHVPDMSRAISEVHRVLRTGGKFYAATNGNGGMRTYLHNVRKLIDPNTLELSDGFSFSLQNGEALLSEYFSEVQSYNYDDSLHITETQDLIDWMKSTIAISNYSESDFDRLYSYFENIRIEHGAIDIPKELGLFISTK